jgi:hypothetical protein
MGCESSNPHGKISFELTHGSTEIVGATTLCNGGDVRDTAILPTIPPQTLQLAFTGDMSGVSAAYLIIAPTF